MTDRLNEVVLQSFIAAMVVEGLLRLWGVTSPHARLEARFGSLLLPVLLFPLFELVAPFRHEAWFADGPALLATRHLGAVEVGGVGLDRLLGFPAFTLGVLLLARDLWPLLLPRGRRTAEAPPGLERFERALRDAAREAGVAVPRVTVVDGPGPLLLCVGMCRPRVLVSARMLELLDDGELRAAVAHELSHVRWHDVLASWVLLAVRVLSAFNPVTQVLGRTVAWETELRADADAAAWTRKPAALASALLKVHGQPSVEAPGRLALSAQLERARTFAIEARCRRLLDSPVVQPRAQLTLHFVAAGLVLSALLFFVTS